MSDKTCWGKPLVELPKCAEEKLKDALETLVADYGSVLRWSGLNDEYCRFYAADAEVKVCTEQENDDPDLVRVRLSFINKPNDSFWDDQAWPLVVRISRPDMQHFEMNLGLKLAHLKEGYPPSR